MSDAPPRLLSPRQLTMVLGLAVLAFGAGVVTGARGGDGALATGGGELERQALENRLLTSPFLECVGQANTDIDLLRSRAAVVRLIDEARALDPTLRVSVYVRDLLDGPWIGVAEREPFIPASLLKVSVLLHAMARVEQDPTLMERTFVFPGADAMPNEGNLDDLPPEYAMQEGESYSFGELLERMIVVSDNHAKELVLTDVDPRGVDAYLANAGFQMVERNGQAHLDARSYASLFRMLYNATLLSRTSSEFALSLLARARSPRGLRRDLPADVVVASKFGVHRGAPDAGGGTQLHECGIVYGPQRPYVICVMTRSDRSGVDTLADIIAGVSRIVHAGEAD
jgi:beta-lactamase class A